MTGESFYLDASVALRILYAQSPAASVWFEQVTGEDDTIVFSSRLLRTEITRVLRRDRRTLELRDEILDYLQFMPIDDGVLIEAETIIPHVKTLDAIHLASVIRSGLDATVVTHDSNMAAVATMIGYPVLDPVTD